MQSKFAVAIVQGSNNMKDHIFKALVNKKQEIRINLRQTKSPTLKKIDKNTQRIIRERQKFNYSANQHRTIASKQLLGIEAQENSLASSGLETNYFQVIQRSNNRLASLGWSEFSPLRRTSKMSRTYRRINIDRHNSQEHAQKFITIPRKQLISKEENLLSLITLDLCKKHIESLKKPSKDNQSPSLSLKLKNKQHFYNLQDRKKLTARLNLQKDTNIRSKSFFINKNISQYINQKISVSKEKLTQTIKTHQSNKRNLSLQNINNDEQNKQAHLFIQISNPYSSRSRQNHLKLAQKQPCSLFTKKKSQTFYQKNMNKATFQLKKDPDIYNFNGDKSPLQCRPWSVSKLFEPKASFTQNIQGKLSMSQKDDSIQNFSGQKLEF